MPTLTKSPVAFAVTALRVAQEAMPPYSHPKSPQKFTQAQLFAILALRDFFQTDYRRIIQMLSEWSDLREALGLTKMPHYSTLCYAEKRMLKKGASENCWQKPSASPVAAA
jgi:hypothetical protein